MREVCIKMSKSAFWENEQSKEFALRYFDYFFDYSFNVTTRYSLEDLEKKYMDYCKSYFVRFHHKLIQNEEKFR